MARSPGRGWLTAAPGRSWLTAVPAGTVRRQCRREPFRHRSARLVETDMLRGRPGARLALLIETSSRSA